MMTKLFNRGWNAVTLTTEAVTNGVDELTSMDAPLQNLPTVIPDHPSSIGDDVNLPLLVKEMGGRKKIKLARRREELLKELQTIDKELTQLDVLLDAANSI